MAHRGAGAGPARGIPLGIGTTVGTLFDEVAAVGSVQQSVLLRPR
jgi:hypothetical protein